MKQAFGLVLALLALTLLALAAQLTRAGALPARGPPIRV
jgi:hypothetical protein